MPAHSSPALWLAILACVAVCATVQAATPTGQELARARKWSAQYLRSRPTPPPAAEAPAPPVAGIEVLANHGDVLLDGRPDGRLIRLGAVEYGHGLLCHAPSKLLVRLPGPGARFTALVGIDANAGGGSVVFHVTVDGAEVYRSEVLHGGEPGVPVSVDLAGAREFTIEADDAGDGIACDHASWARAEATLADGRTLPLSGMAIGKAAPPPRPGANPPFSFTYGGVHSDRLLPGWARTEATERLSEGRTRHTQTYRDPATGLEVRCVAVEYADYPVVEWTAYLRNTGDADTPLVENLQALDAAFGRGAEGEFLLHHSVGSPCQPFDFQPLETPLPAGASKRITAAGGRPTNTDLCYFNLEWPEEGVIVALGWPGQWAADFVRDAGAKLRIIAGQELTRFTLHPGEEVRTPLVALLFWQGGDWLRAQNLWRGWMVAHNVPRVDGKPVATHYGSCFSNLQPVAAEETSVIRAAAERGADLDFWFLDAGWYPDRGGWWWTGTWETDPERFPNGMREVSDLVHASGWKFVLWFEPERVTQGSWLAENHPEWILGGAEGGLVDYGNPEAWRWVVEHFNGLIDAWNIDVYRQDFNMDPLGYWRGNDAPDRQGITENHHVVGYLAYWDEILRRHPGLYIDTCASGGRRNDLETLRRSVPLLRSDAFGTAEMQQAQTLGLSLWIPYFGSGMGMGNLYWFRSCIFPAARVGGDFRDPEFDIAFLNRMIAECRRVQRYQMGEFYPLTPWSLDENQWIAWQYQLPESGEGAIQVFRRAQCEGDSVTLPLRGLNPDRRYGVRNADTDGMLEFTGRELMTRGLPVTIPDAPGAAVLYYKAL